MHVENLNHWVAISAREMYLSRYGHAGIPVVVLLHLVVVTADTMILA